MLRIFAALAGALLIAGQALAQAWPSKPVRFIVSTPAGTSPDIVARMLSDRLQKVFGQTFLVDNVTGAGGILAGIIGVFLAVPVAGVVSVVLQYAQDRPPPETPLSESSSAAD